MNIHQHAFRFTTNIFLTSICIGFGLFSNDCPAQQEQRKNIVQTSKTNNLGSPEKSGGANVFTLKSVGSAEGGKRADFAWEDGKTAVKLSDFSKGKPVFLNFWATWCPPCRRELPAIVKLHKQLADKVVFIGLACENEASTKKSAPKVSSFLQKNNIGYLNIVGDEDAINKISAAYGNVEVIPTTFIIDNNGVIIDKLVGDRSEKDFLAALKKVM